MDSFARRFLPTTEDVVDLVFAFALMSLAVAGFGATFSGREEIWTGIPSVIVGVLTGWLIYRSRIGPLLGLVVAALVFFAAGAVLAVPDFATAGLLPNAETSRELVDGVTSGWIRLLTSLPPAGGAGNLLAIPFFCGFAGGLLSILSARLSRWSVCVVFPFATLVAAILMGTEEPASLVVQGVMFSGVTLGWVVVRRSRYSSVVAPQFGFGRAMSMAGVLVVTAVAGSWLAPVLPGADSEDRFVLRSDVIPPFDPLLEPSPLAGFRRYTGAEKDDKVVMEVSGLAPGVRLRLATMDVYDQLVWKSSGDGTALGGTFIRVGSEIPATTDGETVRAEVEIVSPHGVWLPMVGDVSRIEFLGDNENAVDWLRFNLTTESAVIATGVRAGDHYIVEGVIPFPHDDVELDRLGLDARYRLPDPEQVPAQVRALAAELAGDATTPYAQLRAIAAALTTKGAYSDGGEEAPVPTAPGHSIARLVRFLGATEWVGNGEQYAAALALLATARAIPVRVVMGFETNTDDVQLIRGSDVVAWVEVPLAGVGWVPVDGTPPRTNLPNPDPEPRPRILSPEPQPPPPVVPPPAAEPPEALTVEDPAPEEVGEELEPESAEDGGFPILVVALAAPVLLLVLLVAVVVVWKLLRRRRRRSRGTPATRVSGAWRDVVDVGRDFGRDSAVMLTRPEAAQVLRASAATELGERADSVLFGRDEPTDEDAVEVWALADEARRDLRRQHGRTARARASTSRASLRRPTTAASGGPRSR